jgi:hypothetical protein
MIYFQTLKLGKTYQDYNQEFFTAFLANTNNEKQLHNDFKYFLKIFEPKKSKYDALTNAIHQPDSDKGKEYNKYLAETRIKLHEVDIENTIKALEKECEEYSKEEYLERSDESIRSKKIDFWASWYYSVWSIWGNLEGVSDLESSFSKHLHHHYINLINDYFWDELNLRLFGNDTTNNQLSRSIELESLKKGYEFIDFHFLKFEYEVILFINNLKVICNSKGSKPSDLYVKKVLQDWIDQKETFLSFNKKQQTTSTENIVQKKKTPKSKTLNDYRLKYQSIEYQIEIAWNKENHKTEKKLKKLYLDERKKYVKNNIITLSQLNRELKQVDGWNKLKEQIMKHYGQFV